MASLNSTLEIVDQLTDTLKDLVRAFDQRISKLERAVAQGAATNNNPRRGSEVPTSSAETKKKKVSFQKNAAVTPKVKNAKKTWDAGDDYVVEKILDRQLVKGKVQYKVKWQGWSLKDCTWEPIEHLETVQSLVDDFEQNRKEKSGTKRPKSAPASTKKKEQDEPERKLQKLAYKVSPKRPSRSR